MWCEDFIVANASAKLRSMPKTTSDHIVYQKPHVVDEVGQPPDVAAVCDARPNRRITVACASLSFDLRLELGRGSGICCN